VLSAPARHRAQAEAIPQRFTPLPAATFINLAA
jgi:hypothetical protein